MRRSRTCLGLSVSASAASFDGADDWSVVLGSVSVNKTCRQTTTAAFIIAVSGGDVVETAFCTTNISRLFS